MVAIRRLKSLIAALAVVGLLSSVGIGVMAQGGPPPPDATPGTSGISSVVLAGLDPVAAPGRVLDMREFTWEPGSYITPHTHPAAFIICIQQGSVGFSIQSGAAVVARSDRSDPAETEPMAVDDAVVLEPGDCVSVDEEPRTIHTVWNAGDETAVSIETYLFDRDQPGRTFVDAQGTPVPQ